MMPVIVRSREGAEEVLRSGSPRVDALVSIHAPCTSPWARHHPQLGFPCAGFAEFKGPKLALVFDDVRARSAGDDVPPTAKHIEALAAFAASLPDDATVLFHCTQGASRSPAAAFIYLAMKYGPGREVSAMDDLLVSTKGLISPNMILLYLADKCLDRNGAMVSLWEDWEARQRSNGIYGG